MSWQEKLPFDSASRSGAQCFARNPIMFDFIFFWLTKNCQTGTTCSVTCSKACIKPIQKSTKKVHLICASCAVRNRTQQKSLANGLYRESCAVTAQPSCSRTKSRLSWPSLPEHRVPISSRTLETAARNGKHGRHEVSEPHGISNVFNTTGWRKMVAHRLIQHRVDLKWEHSNVGLS